jgi:caa(3)-type oxidase subunit IV
MSAPGHSTGHSAGHAAGHAAAGHTAAHPVHRNYVKIWAVLVVLLVISVAGPFLGIRVVTLATAFGIALVKAYMVAKNFMHLDVEKPIVHWLLAIILVLMVLLFAGVAPDVMKDKGRMWKKGPEFHTLPPEHAPEAGGGHGHGAEGH